jgi:hypothetical protein
MSDPTAGLGAAPKASLTIDCPRPGTFIPVSLIVNGTHTLSKEGDVVKCQALSKGVVIQCRTCVLTTGSFTWCCKLNLDRSLPDGSPIILQARLEDSTGLAVVGPFRVDVVLDRTKAGFLCDCTGDGTVTACGVF